LPPKSTHWSRLEQHRREGGAYLYNTKARHAPYFPSFHALQFLPGTSDLAWYARNGSEDVRPRLELGRGCRFTGMAGLALFQAEIVSFSESNIKGFLQWHRIKNLVKAGPSPHSKCLIISRYFEGILHFTQGCGLFMPNFTAFSQVTVYISKASQASKNKGISRKLITEFVGLKLYCDRQVAALASPHRRG
jgi:hypothetical protein